MISSSAKTIQTKGDSKPIVVYLYRYLQVQELFPVPVLWGPLNFKTDSKLFVVVKVDIIIGLIDFLEERFREHEIILLNIKEEEK